MIRIHPPSRRAGRPVSRTRRRGAALVETAVVLSVFLTLLLGTLDLALAVRQYNAVSDAARQVTREAIVHGRLGPPRRTVWGPAAYAGTAADAHEIAQAARPTLVGIDPARVSLTVSWPDGGNDMNQRVRCTVGTTYRPIMTSLFPGGELKLDATSTMLIAH